MKLTKEQQARLIKAHQEVSDKMIAKAHDEFERWVRKDFERQLRWMVISKIIDESPAAAVFMLAMLMLGAFYAVAILAADVIAWLAT